MRLLLAAIVAMVFSGCETQEDFTREKKRETFKASQKSLQELLLLDNFNNAYRKVMVKKADLAARSALEDAFNFTISDRPVNIVEIDQKTFYNMLIERDSVDPQYVENLLIMMEKVNDVDEMSAYIIKYLPEIDVVATTITPIVSRVNMYCSNVCSLKCPILGSGFNHVHNFDMDTCSGEGVYLECYEVCFPSVFGNAIGDGGSVPLGPTGGGGGGSAATVIVNPANQNGAAQDQLVVMPVYVDEEEDEDDPCLQLKNLSNTTKANIKPNIDYLKTKLYEPKESGFSLRRRSSTNEYTAVPGMQTQDGFSVALDKGEYYYGGMHTHPIGGQNMFSWGDLKYLRNVCDDATPQNKKLAVLILVARDNLDFNIERTYAIRINDFNKLNEKINADLNNPDYTGYSEKRKIDEIHKILSDEYEEKKDDIQKAFLEYFADYGVSLYEANPEITNWNQLTLQNLLLFPNSQTTVQSKPCN